MATLSTHTLDSTDGTHAGGVRIRLVRIDVAGARKTLIDSATDAGGRFLQEIDVGPGDTGCEYELVVGSSDYFAKKRSPPAVVGLHLVKEAVIRFSMPDPKAKYHIPMMLAPNSHSVWWSS